MAAEATAEAPTEVQEAPDAPPPDPPEPAKKAAKTDAKKAAKESKGGKGKGKDKQGKDGKGAGEDAEQADGPSVAAHPRAARAIARAKSWGGLLGFALGGYMALPTNTVAAAGLRALVAGIVGYVAVWAGAVFLWRRLVMIEIKNREHQLVEATRAAAARRALPPGGERQAGRAAS
jgi:hypothetical protein